MMKPEAFEGNAKVVTFIPVKNEAQSIGEVIKLLRKFDTEIVVVDGNSSDGTGNLGNIIQ